MTGWLKFNLLFTLYVPHCEKTVFWVRDQVRLNLWPAECKRLEHGNFTSSKLIYYSFKIVNNISADQPVKMCMLVCTFYLQTKTSDFLAMMPITVFHYMGCDTRKPVFVVSDLAITTA